jgi:hypothetical protein
VFALSAASIASVSPLAAACGLVVIDAGSGGGGCQPNIHLLCVYACTYI